MVKKYYCLLVIGCIIGDSDTYAQYLRGYDLSTLANTHDVTAPSWGPYSKKYAGISHIADSVLGTRFDFTVVAGYFKGKLVVPNHKYQSGFHPWNASANLETYSFREEIEWKDKIYADVAFAPYSSSKGRLVQIELVNNTSELQSLTLNLMAGLQYDNTPVKVQLPKNATWIKAINYTALMYAKPRPDDNLRADGLLKGEARNNDFTDGSGLADGFGKDAGDKVAFALNNEKELQNAQLLIRYKIAENKQAVLKTTGFLNSNVELNGTGDFTTKIFPVGQLNVGRLTLEMIAQTNTAIELDGFCLVEESEIKEVRFIPFKKNPKPILEQNLANQNLILKYADLTQYYGIAWDAKEEASVRDVVTDDYDNAIKGATEFIYEHNYAVRNDAYNSNIYLRVFNVPAHSKRLVNVVLCQGSKNEVVTQLQQFTEGKKIVKENISTTDNADFENINPAGKPFLFSQQRMKATMLQNIIYPLYNQQQTIKQFVPGKRWNSLYTWDLGFVGLGMLDIDVQRAIETLNGYTNPSTEGNAYIQHGSPVPIQFFIFQALWNRTQDKTLLQYFYDRLKNYYLFFTGQLGSSTTRKLKSGMLNTYDYFYNASGMDDYPAQSFARDNKMYGRVAPVISTSMAIRMAKTMQSAALILGIEKDTSLYQTDIDFFTKTLQQNSWDEASGYFGYVLHDSATLQATGILRTKEGLNYNMGVEGVYPLVAGICTHNQKAKALEHLFLPNQCWTPYGITVVDQSAPYFNINGYWNGAVWFPHQFILWKTMLDIGEGKRAAQIALTALKLYKKEVDSTYNCFEMVRLLTGHASGWHQFGALSAPILNWFAAYYRPGAINVGFDGWVMQQSFSTDKTSLKAQLQFSSNGKKTGVLVCMKAGKKYAVLVNGKSVVYDETVKGALYFNVPIGKGLVDILIR